MEEKKNWTYEEIMALMAENMKGLGIIFGSSRLFV
jgi:hypothetical protein